MNKREEISTHYFKILNSLIHICTFLISLFFLPVFFFVFTKTSVISKSAIVMMTNINSELDPAFA
jgi:hypothetical protein